MIARPGRVATLPRFMLTLGLYGFWRRRTPPCSRIGGS